jgi:hypothetical protein
VPQSILYDNTRLAVARIVKSGKRLRSQMFAELQSHYLFEDKFGRPDKGNDKGKVEGPVGFFRRNFMTPLPVADSFEALDARLLDACVKRRQAILRGHTATIDQRMQADAAAFMLLPQRPMTPATRSPRASAQLERREQCGITVDGGRDNGRGGVGLHRLPPCGCVEAQPTKLGCRPPA